MMEGAKERRKFEEAEGHLFQSYGIEFTARYLELEKPRLRARVLEAGSGNPLLLVHGGGGNAAGWVPLLAELSGLRLLAVDRPGCGLTDGFNYRHVDFRQHAVSFLESVLDELQLARVPVVGNSMGGLWSFWLAIVRPERVSAVIQLGCPDFILGTGNLIPFPMRLLSVRVLNRIMFAMQPPSPKQLKTLLKRMGHDDNTISSLSTEFIECQVAAAKLPTFRTGWLTLLERVLNLRGPDPELALGEDELRQVRQPVLFLWGDGDPFGGPEVGHRAVGIVPDAELKIIHGGHLPWLDDSVSMGRATREFLRKRNLVSAAH